MAVCAGGLFRQRFSDFARVLYEKLRRWTERAVL
jgi:hypothetical protein